MSRAKTTAQWRRDDPVFAAMSDDVVRLRNNWPGTHSVAHRDETTGAVTFHLHVREHDLGKLRQMLGNIPVNPMRDARSGLTTYHFRGRRPDMDRLLSRLGATR